jgi:hypothetical protein
VGRTLPFPLWYKWNNCRMGSNRVCSPFEAFFRLHFRWQKRESTRTV